MNDEQRTRIGTVAGKLVQEIMTTGLTWDEAVAVFGLAAKATAQAAARMGAGTPVQCVTLARVRFEDAFAQDVRVVVAVTGAPPRDDSADNSLPPDAHRRTAANVN